MFCANCGNRIIRNQPPVVHEDLHTLGANIKSNKTQYIFGTVLIVLSVFMLVSAMGIKPELEWTKNGLEYVNKGESLRWLAALLFIFGGLVVYGGYCKSKTSFQITDHEIIGESTNPWIVRLLTSGIGVKMTKIPLKTVTSVSGKSSHGELFITANGREYCFFTSEVDKAQKIILERMGK